jgi:hypothetical protein
MVLAASGGKIGHMGFICHRPLQLLSSRKLNLRFVDVVLICEQRHVVLGPHFLNLGPRYDHFMVIIIHFLTHVHVCCHILKEFFEEFYDKMV